MSGDDPRLPTLLAALRARADAPVDGREAAAVRRFQAELAALDRPFDRAAGAVHVTASSIVVGPPGVLLHRHRRLGLWLQPGGHIDGDEALPDAALREAVEETGLADARLADGAVAHVDVHGGGLGHVHLDVRYVVLASTPPAPPAGESQDVAWFSWEGAIATADPGLAGALRAMARALGRLSAPATPPGSAAS